MSMLGVEVRTREIDNLLVDGISRSKTLRFLKNFV